MTKTWGEPNRSLALLASLDLLHGVHQRLIPQESRMLLRHDNLAVAIRREAEEHRRHLDRWFARLWIWRHGHELDAPQNLCCYPPSIRFVYGFRMTEHRYEWRSNGENPIRLWRSIHAVIMLLFNWR